MIVVKIRVEVLPNKRKEFEQSAQWLIESQPKVFGVGKANRVSVPNSNKPQMYSFQFDLLPREVLDVSMTEAGLEITIPERAMASKNEAFAVDVRIPNENIRELLRKRYVEVYAKSPGSKRYAQAGSIRQVNHKL